MKKIRITESQLKKVINLLVNEQVKNSIIPGLPSILPPKGPEFGCIGPNDWNQIGESHLGIVYKMRDGEYQLNDEGIARKWSNTESKQMRRGTWKCSPNNDSIEVRWEDNPKAVQYFGLPKNSFGKSIGKSIDTSKCAKEMTDIFSGKFLLKGCKGPVVTDLQNRLNKLGYKLNPDGAFGDATKQAVMRYQESKGIQVDGVFGRSTLDFLVGDEIGKGPKSSNPIKTPLNPKTKLTTNTYPKDK